MCRRQVQVCGGRQHGLQSMRVTSCCGCHWSRCHTCSSCQALSLQGGETAWKSRLREDEARRASGRERREKTGTQRGQESCTHILPLHSLRMIPFATSLWDNLRCSHTTSLSPSLRVPLAFPVSLFISIFTRTLLEVLVMDCHE